MSDEDVQHEDVADDGSIGRAAGVSLAVVAVIVGVVALVFALLRQEPPVEEVERAPIALPERAAETEIHPPEFRFVDVTTEAGIDFVHNNRATGDKLLPETMGGGVALLDYDNDGDQDLLLIDSNRWPWDEVGGSAGSLRLYANDGAGRFNDVSVEAGLTVACYGMGVAVGDYDNDGDPDVFVTAVGKNRLLRNDDGKFADATDEAGVAGAEDGWGSSCAWFDADNDGDLDLIVGNYVTWSPEIDLAQDFRLTGIGRAYGPPFSFAGSFPYLYRNDGAGRFTDVSESAGVRVTNPATGVPLAKTLGVRPIDANGDGWMDVVLANDTVQNLLLMNDGAGGFREEGALAGLAFDAAGKARGAMGVDAARFRDDGSLGIAIANFANEMTALYVSGADEAVFVDDAIATGLGPATRTDLSFGLFFFDADLDGRLDLLAANGHIENEIHRVQKRQRYQQPSRLFWNAGPESVEEFLPVSGAGDLDKPVVGRGAAYGDLDGDGDLDVVVTQIAGSPLVLRNDTPTGHHFVRLRLEGVACNRDAIGATVTARVGERTLVRQVMPARSYLSSVEKALTIGLGEADRLDELIVVWPDGSTQAVLDAVIDGATDIRQNTPETP